MQNPIQTYAWGSYTAIPRLQGLSGPASQPQAELWMGAHPKAPSQIMNQGEWEPLPDAIHRNPRSLLGAATANAHGGQLPYLFKVLASREPLSIQAHPSLSQAREGYAREDRQGIPLDATHRNYRDPNHKPELVCALDPFWALCGFRPVDDMAAQLKRLCPHSLAEEISALGDGTPEVALRRFYALLLEMKPTRRAAVLSEALGNARRHAPKEDHFRWIIVLAEKYPGDMGILAPAILNCLCLEPGQALYLPAGELHAYLEGTAIELMANSDNVLRGGLTPKHVDPAELLKVLNFESRTPQILLPEPLNDVESVYPTWTPEFQLVHMELDGTRPHTITSPYSAEILLCIHGQAHIQIPDTGDALTVTQGSSVLIPAAAPDYQISGPARLFKAGVPLPEAICR